MICGLLRLLLPDFWSLVKQKYNIVYKKRQEIPIYGELSP
jgi:hypothetical protein